MRAIVAIILLLPMAFMAHADGDGNDGDDQEWARDAVLAGKAVPLAHIIESLEHTHDATVYEVDLLKSDDPSVASMYRVKLISGDGRLVELLIDTSSGKPVGIGGQGISQGIDDGQGEGGQGISKNHEEKEPEN